MIEAIASTETTGDYQRGGLQKFHYSPSEVVEVACPMCGRRDGRTLATEYGAVGVKRCAGCSLIYTSPRIEEPEKVYWGNADDYLAEARLIFSGQATHHRDPNYNEELDLIEQFVPDHGRFMDVGCNMGMLLRLARARGWDTIGVEPSPTLHSIATGQLGLNVHNCFLDEVPESENGSCDVVALSDVFEHVTEPLELLSASRRMLKAGGVLYVKVPNARWNILKQRLSRFTGGVPAYGIWDSYEHVVHYTDATLREMLQKGGFDPQQITFSRPIQIPVWHAYVGQYFQYPSPWTMDPKRHLGRALAHELGRLEARVSGRVGYLAQNLVAIARAA